jgi:uncharacterized membrane protein YdjX (TVP38/TMEM64 family)
MLSESESTATDVPEKRRGLRARLMALVCIVGVIGIGWLYFAPAERLDAEAILRYLRTQHPLAARLTYIAAYAIGTVLLVPGTMISVAGALLFGPYEGTLHTWIGACLGAGLAFLVARWLGRPFVVKLFNSRLNAFDAYVEGRGFWGVLVLRLLPIFPFNLINYGTGLTSVRYRDFLFATMIGIVPGTFVYQYLFASVGQRILTDGIDWQMIDDRKLWLPFGLFLLFLVVSSLLAHRYRGSDKAESAAK